MYWPVIILVIVVAALGFAVIKLEHDEVKRDEPHVCSCCGKNIPPGSVICSECEQNYEDMLNGDYM